MAVLKQKLNRKNDSGTYDEIHLKTDASNVSMSTTDETLLSTKISSMDTAIAGKQPVGSYAAANHNHNGVYATVGQYNELKTSVSNGKSAVASAITDKGVSTSATASFNTMANNIRKIQTAAGSIYDITAHDGTLFNNDTNASYFPFLIINSGGGITVKAAGSDASYRDDLIFHFGIKGAKYTKVWAYENNSYSTGESFAIAIYEYKPFDLSTLVQKSYIVGSFSKRYSAQELGFTMSPNKVYLIVVKDSGVAKQYIKFIT